MAADCLAAPRRNFEADSAAPWQRAPPLDHVQVAAVREAYVRLSMSRDRGCGHHAVETPLHSCTAVRVPKYHSVRKGKKVFIVILIPKPSLNFRTGLSQALTLLFFSCTAAELQVTRNPAIDVDADSLAAPRRNFEADSAAPWQRAPPLHHVQVAAVRAAWHES